MTSFMQRPRSTQPAEFGGHSGDEDFYRSAGANGMISRLSGMADHSSASGNVLSGHGVGQGNIASPSVLGMLGQDHGGLGGTFQGYLGDPSSSSSPSSRVQQNDSNARASSFDNHSAGAGIFDDPAILALVGDQPFDPRIDFELDLQSEALAAMQQHPSASQHRPQSHPTSSAAVTSSSLHPTSNVNHGQRQAIAHLAAEASSDPSSSSSSTSLSNVPAHGAHSTPRPQHQAAPSLSANVASAALPEIDLTSVGGILQFPELPASLLDQAPEYEYSMHTQANVFDAVQDYQGSGEDEAARIFGLDNYDPNLALGGAGDGLSQSALAQGGQNGEDVWRYNDSLAAANGPDPSSGSSFGPHGLPSGDGFASSFADTSSMIDSCEYPQEPSSAPTSRGSEWNKVEAVVGAAAATALSMANGVTGSNTESGGAIAYAGQTPPNAKRRREASYESRPGDATASSVMAPPHHAAYAGLGSGNPPSNLYASPPSKTNDGRSLDGRPANREPMVPSQGVGVQRTRMSSWNGNPLNDASASHRLASDGWQNHASANSFYDSANGAFAVSSFGGNGGGAGQLMGMGEAHAANTSIVRTEMINAIGSAMDASMESDGVAKCPYPNCSKTFAKNRSYNLKAHLRSHSQLKPFQCIHCPRAFSRKHDLERHTRVHSGDKPYLCEACGKGFPRSDALRRHWRVEKECGDKAVEIEAKQPLPSLPPGVNTPAAQAKGPIPGLMHFGAPTTTAAAGAMGMMPPGINPFVPMHAAASHHPAIAGIPPPLAPPGWDSAMPSTIYAGGVGNYYPSGMERKRAREDM